MELFYDTETSGFNNPHIVQLAAVCGPHSINLLIKPDGWEIEPGAEEVHGISQQRALREGIPIGHAMWLFVALCEVATVRVAHNAAYDEKIVALEAERLEMEIPICPVFCTMLASVDHCKLPGRFRGQYKWPKLDEAHRHFFGCGFDNAHDAFADLVACRAIYGKLVELQ